MTGTNPQEMYRELTEHRWYKYRGCAPDPDDAMRPAGNPELTLDAWDGPDVDGGEDQRARRVREAAAKAVCAGCPVLELCAAHAMSVTADGKLAEPRGVRGGRTGRERAELFRQRRRELVRPVAVPVVQVQTPQKLAVLLALAMCSDAQAVADAAGVDVRTANWQRSRLVTQLGLVKESATRGELLAEAVRRGLLEGSVVVPDDGSVLAVPPPGAAPASPSAPAVTVAVAAEGAPEGVSRAVRPRRARRVAGSGQLTLDDAMQVDATVHPLRPAAGVLGAAA